MSRHSWRSLRGIHNLQVCFSMLLFCSPCCRVRGNRKTLFISRPEVADDISHGWRSRPRTNSSRRQAISISHFSEYLPECSAIHLDSNLYLLDPTSCEEAAQCLNSSRMAVLKRKVKMLRGSEACHGNGAEQQPIITKKSGDIIYPSIACLTPPKRLALNPRIVRRPRAYRAQSC